MTDPLDHSIVLPADGQRSYEELREQFREANRQRIRAMTRPDDVAIALGKDSTGNPIYQRVKLGGFRTTAPEGHIHSGFDPKVGAGMYPKFAGEIPNVESMPDEFVVVDSPGLDREFRDLARDAKAMQLHEGVQYPNDNPEGTTTNADTDEDERGPGPTTT